MSNLDELERLLEAATPGPWYACVWDPMERPHISLAEGDHHPNKDIARELSKENAALAVAAVNSLPALIAVARRAEALADEVVSRDALVGWFRRYLASEATIFAPVEGGEDDSLETLIGYAATLTEEGAPR